MRQAVNILSLEHETISQEKRNCITASRISPLHSLPRFTKFLHLRHKQTDRQTSFHHSRDKNLRQSRLHSYNHRYAIYGELRSIAVTQMFTAHSIIHVKLTGFSCTSRVDGWVALSTFGFLYYTADIPSIIYLQLSSTFHFLECSTSSYLRKAKVLTKIELDLSSLRELASRSMYQVCSVAVSQRTIHETIQHDTMRLVHQLSVTRHI